MVIFKSVFRGYSEAVGTISGAVDYHGDVKISIIIPKERVKELFTGKVDLSKLPNKHMKVSVPAIKTEKEEIPIDDREKRLRMRELHQDSKDIQKEMKLINQT